ncbi:hypothetical protein [Sulfitobacter sp. R18_1]|uniref:hypothetical protein n=1 Tax=Sulfitobacter sp. R18_1 TaxID=2821104 RepID=UPI001AD997FB|nr:hypothetical protein [Sulfitobacter sp. R18_1]MBO9428011.1 hypothetical protein [Sulfitobacter sp. R18_1]
MKLKKNIEGILVGTGSTKEKVAAITAMIPDFLLEDCGRNHVKHPVGSGTRQFTSHDGSSASPTKGDHYGIIAIDRWGVEHASKQCDIPHSAWAWEDITLWRYDDPTNIEMMANQIAELQDQASKTA